jgi:hypothetical protein
MLEVADFSRARSKKHAHAITTKLIAARDKAIRAGVAAARAARRAPVAAAEAATGDGGTEEGDDQDGDSSSDESDGEDADGEEELEEGALAVDTPADSARATASASGKQLTVTKDVLTAVVLSLRIAPNDDLREVIQHALETYFIPATVSNGAGSSPAARALADILGIPGSARVCYWHPLGSLHQRLGTRTQVQIARTWLKAGTEHTATRCSEPGRAICIVRLGCGGYLLAVSECTAAAR